MLIGFDFKACLGIKSIDFDKWLGGSDISELEAIEASIINNPQTGNMGSYLRHYIKLYPAFKKLEDSQTKTKRI